MPCIFCEPENERTLHESKHCYVYADRYPVANGHVLIIPKRHVERFEKMSSEEILCIFNSIAISMEKLKSVNPEGFNLGANLGEAAGQTVKHLHFHLIPRRRGDSKNYVGGVRNILPTKAREISREELEKLRGAFQRSVK